MQACEFSSVIDNGIIRLPAQYRNTFNSTVKIIVLFDEQNADELSGIHFPGKLSRPRIHPPKYRGTITADYFSDVKIDTRGFVFNRDEANER
jgi:hypothetical protein